MKKIFIALLAFLALALIAVAGGALIYFGKLTVPTNLHNYKTIGSIPTPGGYERIDGNDADLAQYLRSLPLKPRGSKIDLYTGGEANLQLLGYAVVDMPLLSNNEQCADVCMRLRAEYLYETGQISKIHFQDVDGKTMQFGGGNREAFNSYLRKVYGMASTFSLSRELKHRSLADIQPGDIFVYPALNGTYGHAIMVVDVAENPKTGKRRFLLAEGNTPARSIHLLQNWGNLLLSPWFEVDPDDDEFFLSFFRYKKEDLRHFYS